MMPINLDHDIRATVTNITYKPKHRIGHLRLAHSHVPDMSGTIALFTRIDPHVKRIRVYDGRHLNTEYAHVNGKWTCTYLDNTR